ncbi:UNVERIFIED_CONTAM: hypothetical protein FKN15_026804 [Acipenser sinensis]
MGIQGMEILAVGVVLFMFMAVLKQFGVLEPMEAITNGSGRTAPWPESSVFGSVLQRVGCATVIHTEESHTFAIPKFDVVFFGRSESSAEHNTH